MKILFIFVFIVVCGLAVCKEERTDFDEKTVDAADPKRYTSSASYEQCFVTFFKLDSYIQDYSRKTLNY